MSGAVWGARVVAVAAGLAAVVSLTLPWATQEYVRDLPDGIADVDSVGAHWSGWGLHGASHVDGHRPLPLLVVVLIVLATVALFALSWLAWEAESARWPAVSGLAVALALIVAGFPLLTAIQDHGTETRVVTAEFGFVLWRVAVLLTFLGLARLGVLQERRTRAERAG